jgi:hypothetical protein
VRGIIKGVCKGLNIWERRDDKIQKDQTNKLRRLHSWIGEVIPNLQKWWKSEGKIDG